MMVTKHSNPPGVYLVAVRAASPHFEPFKSIFLPGDDGGMDNHSHESVSEEALTSLSCFVLLNDCFTFGVTTEDDLSFNDIKLLARGSSV